MSRNKKYPSTKKLIVGIGSALVDILAYEGDDFLERTGAVKGGMTLLIRISLNRFCLKQKVTLP